MFSNEHISHLCHFHSVSMRIMFPKCEFLLVFLVILLLLFVCVCPSSFCTEQLVKGVLDKCNIYRFISNSIEDIKSNQYRNFQLILPKHFHFMRYFMNSIIFRVSHRLCCVFIEVDFEK